MTHKKKLPLSIEWYEKIIKDPQVRRTVTKENPMVFFYVYMHRYVQYGIAPFQKEIFAILENEKIKNAAVMAFRGSSKSTLMTTCYPLWAILGKQQKKFIVILSQTQAQARQHLKNIKSELETNHLLRADLGPFEEENFEWGLHGLVLPKYGAKIIAASTEQSIRGIRHMQYRPDVFIADDIEDMQSVKTQEGRDRTYQWLTREIIPAGTPNTRLILVGNFLHEDSILMRFKKEIEEKRFNGIFRKYPLIDENGQVAWPAMFPTNESINELRMSIGSELAWQQEMLLNLVHGEDQIILPEWIDNNYYDTLPNNTVELELIKTITGIDLAISQAQTADCTTMVSVKIYRHRVTRQKHLYILPNPINKRINFAETILLAKETVQSMQCALLVENVGYQRAAIEQLRSEQLYVEEFTPSGDKSVRLRLTTPLFQNNQIHLPRYGAELLRQQILGFGLEKHDDLVDALTMIIIRESLERKTTSIADINTCEESYKTIAGNLFSRQF